MADPQAQGASEPRTAPRAPEQRTVDVDVHDLDTRGRTVHGYAAVYGAEAHLDGIVETIAPGAFAGVLNSDVRCLLNHDANVVLGRTKSGTLRLSDDPRGLRFEVDLPESRSDLREAVARGDLDGASFRFVVGDEEWSGNRRTIRAVKELHDITLATYPAYPATSIELRTRATDGAPSGKEAATLMTDSTTGTPATDGGAQPTTTTPAGGGGATTATPVEGGGASTTTGGLRVEDRAAVGERTIEQRIEDGLRSVRKGENRALTTAASVSPGELSTVLFDRLRASSVVLRTGIRTLTTDADSVTYPTLTADVAPAWYAEAATITPGDPTFATLTATPRKLAHLVQFSNEVLDDSDPSIATVLNDHLLTVLALKLDAGLLEGSGTAPEIRGLKNIAGTQSVSAGTNGNTPTLDMFADAIALLEAVNVPRERMRIIMAPRNVATLRKLKASTGGTYLWNADPATSSPTSIFGVPVYTSAQLTLTETQGTATNANSAYVYDTQSLVYVQRSPIEIELDRSRLFNSDQSEMRAKLRGDLISPTPTGIVRVVGLLP
jgi:HK97 family phage major capsid protein/HK97 family phage prohead protease